MTAHLLVCPTMLQTPSYTSISHFYFNTTYLYEVDSDAFTCKNKAKITKVKLTTHCIIPIYYNDQRIKRTHCDDNTMHTINIYVKAC